jgi:hypothetical protein
VTNKQRCIVKYFRVVQAKVTELKHLQAESAELERLSGTALARESWREL